MNIIVRQGHRNCPVSHQVALYRLPEELLSCGYEGAGEKDGGGDLVEALEGPVVYWYLIDLHTSESCPTVPALAIPRRRTWLRWWRLPGPRPCWDEVQVWVRGRWTDTGSEESSLPLGPGVSVNNTSRSVTFHQGTFLTLLMISLCSQWGKITNSGEHRTLIMWRVSRHLSVYLIGVSNLIKQISS